MNDYMKARDLVKYILMTPSRILDRVSDRLADRCRDYDSFSYLPIDPKFSDTDAGLADSTKEFDFAVCEFAQMAVDVLAHPIETYRELREIRKNVQNPKSDY